MMNNQPIRLMDWTNGRLNNKKLDQVVIPFDRVFVFERIIQLILRHVPVYLRQLRQWHLRCHRERCGIRLIYH